MCRSLGRLGAGVRAGRSSATGSRPRSRGACPFAHTALGRALLGLARCALLPERRGLGPGSARLPARARGCSSAREVADALELEVRREGLTTAAQARERLSFELDEIDALRDASDPAAELVRHGRRLLAAPHRGSAALLDAGEQLDAGALAALVRALDELDELAGAARAGAS